MLTRAFSRLNFVLHECSQRQIKSAVGATFHTLSSQQILRLNVGHQKEREVGAEQA